MCPRDAQMGRTFLLPFFILSASWLIGASSGFPATLPLSTPTHAHAGGNNALVLAPCRASSRARGLGRAPWTVPCPLIRVCKPLLAGRGLPVSGTHACTHARAHGSTPYVHGNTGGSTRARLPGPPISSPSPRTGQTVSTHRQSLRETSRSASNCRTWWPFAHSPPAAPLQIAASGLPGAARLPSTWAAECGHRRPAAGSSGWAGPPGLARSPPLGGSVHMARRARGSCRLSVTTHRAARPAPPVAAAAAGDPVASLINSGLGCCVRLFQLPACPQRSLPGSRSIIWEANRCAAAPE